MDYKYAEKTLLIKPGEYMLKGDNRKIFEKRLVNNIKSILNKVANYEFDKESGRLYIHIIESKYSEQEIALMLSKVFGIVAVSIAYKLPQDMDTLTEFISIYAKSLFKEKAFQSFRVSTKRADKNFELQSPEVSRICGGKILEALDSLRVDLFEPEKVFNIEIRPSHIYVYAKEIRAHGGLPVGSAGRGILMLSGGIDSPVAGYMMAKRGIELEAVYFHSEPYTSEKAKEKVIDLAKIIKPYTLINRIHVVNFTNAQMEIYKKCPHNELTIIMRRVMYFIINEIGKRTYAQAVVTGESLGQVASQTIESLYVTDSASDFLVLRPLIGMDKNEIVNISRLIETYETSILPYQDCCTIFVAKHPKTKPRLHLIEASEQALDIESIVEECMENIEVIEI